jgi:hypothetical protein
MRRDNEGIADSEASPFLQRDRSALAQQALSGNTGTISPGSLLRSCHTIFSAICFEFSSLTVAAMIC